MAKAAVTRSIRDDHQKNFLKIFQWPDRKA